MSEAGDGRPATAARDPLPRLVLYGRPACGLCADMEQDLRRLAPELGFALTVVDVDADPALAERYGPRVPVLAGAGGEICHFFLDPAALRRYLRAD